VTAKQIAERRTRLVLVLASVAVALLAFGVRPDLTGSPDEYTRIGRITDCTQLQREVDTATANYELHIAGHEADLAEVDTSYLDAARTRMRDLGCQDATPSEGHPNG
jgi:hypothetical protein